MRRVLPIAALIPLGLGLWTCAALSPPSPLSGSSERFTLRGVRVVNPLREHHLDVSLRVSAGRIDTIARSTPGDGGDEFPELSGSVVLPGLVDMHAHLPPANALRLSGYFAFLYLSHGVTSIRDVGDGDGSSVETAREGLASGGFPGPRIFSCGPFVVGGEPLRWPNSRIVRTPADAEALAADFESAGHTCIKAYEDLSVEAIRALEDAARRHGLQLLGHVPTALSYEEALLPDVQHFFGVPPPESLSRDHILNRAAQWDAVDGDRLDRIVQVSVEHGIINTPTLVSTQQLLLFRDYEAAQRDPLVRLMPRLYPAVVWSPTEGLPFWRSVEDFLPGLEAALEKKKDLLGRLHRAGARLQLGTDAQQPFVVPGASLHQEMQLFAEAGIAPEEVWAMATWRAAERMGVPGLGTLRPGAPADFLVFARDPTRDLAALDDLQAVVSKGRIYLRPELDAAREAYRDHFRGRLVDAVSIAAARFSLGRTVLRDY